MRLQNLFTNITTILLSASDYTNSKCIKTIDISDQQNLIPTATSIFQQIVTLETHDTLSMSTTTNPEQAVAYAALILADDSIAITPEKLQVLLKASGIEDVEPIWTTLFSKALEGKSVNDILTSVEAPVVRSGQYQTSAEHHDCCNEVAEEGAKDGKKDNEDGESECDLTFGLFD